MLPSDTADILPLSGYQGNRIEGQTLMLKDKRFCYTFAHTGQEAFL